MTNISEDNNTPDEIGHHSHHVRLPGFIIDEDIGLGDVIKRTAYYFGMQPCGGCEHRAAELNRWMVFTR